MAAPTDPPPNSPVRLFDTRLVRLRKARATPRGGGADFLLRRSVEDMLDRLEAIPRKFERVLILGGGELFSKIVAARILGDAGASTPPPLEGEGAGGGVRHVPSYGVVSSPAQTATSRSAISPPPLPLPPPGGGDLQTRPPSLSARVGMVVEADIARGEVQVDPEHLPFAEESFNLVVSPLLLHWVNNLPGALTQVRRILKPDGLMLASLFGGETLSELRLSLIEAEEEMTGGAAQRVSPFAELADVAGLVQRAGFALPAADRDTIVVRYADPMRLIADLRAMGETSALLERAPALRRDVFARAMAIYAERFAADGGGVRATFEIFTATGWAPHESQQQPLKPGSAKARLADALGVKERNAGEKTGGG